MKTAEEIQKRINEYIGSTSFSGTPKELYDPIVYIMSQGGKRLRPTLCLMACELFGGDIDNCLPSALAAEVFHNFTLVHDDIMDQAPIRRGKETVYKKWNSNIAILAGDVMQTKALELALSHRARHTYDVVTELCKVAREVCEGQQYDLNFETQDNVSIAEYIEMIRLKTAVLLGSVLKIGGLVAGASEEDIKNIYDFGINLGIAFQLQDDIFDCYGDAKTFGKMPGGDIADNKKTYLYLKALELSDDDDKKKLISLFSMKPGRDDNKMRKVLDIYGKYEVKKLVTDIMRTYYDKSLTYLDKLSVPMERQKALRDYAEALYFREK